MVQQQSTKEIKSFDFEIHFSWADFKVFSFKKSKKIKTLYEGISSIET